MDKQQIFNELKDIIVDKIGVEPYEVINEAKFRDDLGFDSLDSIEIIMEVEKCFNISIPDDEAENLETIGMAVDYLFDKIN